MARIEKTVFISYRRKDISWALAVYQYLTSQKYDVFFDYTSIPSGDFEQIIVSNIKARAHFVLILTPTALDRCSNPGDWLRREIETAIDEKRNIIPLFFDGFSFGLSSVIEKLTGKLETINRYNGLDVPSGYFMEAMERLRSRYLNVPLNAVLHPVPTEVRKVVREEQVAADKALIQKREDIEELVKPAEGNSTKPEQVQREMESPSFDRRKVISKIRISGLRRYGFAGGILLFVILGLFAINFMIQYVGRNVHPTETELTTTRTYKPTQTVTITETPTITPTATQSGPTDYIIQEGDTLQAIAEKFDLGPDGVLLLYIENPAIAEQNGVYFVGQTLRIPAPGSVLPTPTSINLSSGTRVDYQVLPGDTLAGIAAKFNSVVDNIIAVNNITDPNAVKVGDTLKIPVNLVTATPTLPPMSTPFTPTIAGQTPVAPTATLAAAGGNTLISSKDGMTVVYVPAGNFLLGSDNGASDEKPVHSVYLGAFWIDKTEVTNAMYALCVKDGKCSLPSTNASSTRGWYYENSEFDDYPVIFVSWNDAKTYCEWADRRLPTEAEWEKSASWDPDNQEKRVYPWGNTIDCTYANYYGHDKSACTGDTTKVGSYPLGVSFYGALDMAGNVSEWVNDWYDSSYYGVSPSSDPSGPASGQYRVFRGGSWSPYGVSVRSANRFSLAPTYPSYDVGFRCALSP